MPMCPVCRNWHNGSHICDKPSPTVADYRKALDAFKAEAVAKHPMTTRELSYNQMPVCPWCGHSDTDAYQELDDLKVDGDTQTTCCPKCDRDYEVTFHLQPEYSTRKP